MKTMSNNAAGILILFINFTCFIGCSSIQSFESQSIEKNYAHINFHDGVNKSEAKVIAQKELLAVAKDGPYLSLLPNIENRDHYWEVIFSSYSSKKKYYIVNVNKDKGEIEYSHESDTY